MKKIIFAIFSLLLTAFQLLGQSPTKQDQNAPAKPLIAVILERQTIRDDDAIQVQIWFSNELEQDLSNVVLHVAAPSFLNWKAASCAEWKNNSYQEENNQPLAFGAIRAHSVRSQTLCLKSGTDIIIGDYTVLFTFDYSWTTPNGVLQSFVTIEKPLKANLFGTDNIAGIPLALAGFIIPGLFFWIVVSGFSVPWLPLQSGQLPLGEKLIYSVLISIGILALSDWFKLMDASSGVSFAKLAYLALVGALFGFVTGGSTQIWLLIKRKILEAAEKAKVKIDDNEQVLQEKLSRSNSGIRNPKAIVQLKNDNRIFIGSFAKQENATALMGWYKVSLDGQQDSIKTQLKKLVREGDWYQAFVLAHKNKIPTEMNNPIYELINGTEHITEDTFKKWENDQILNIRVETDDKGREPIILV